LTQAEHLFIILNMSSVAAFTEEEPVADDRTAKARIRDAAIQCFAEAGIDGTTARKVATRAGVSPGLVIHHFESMEGLRSECDRYVAATIREYKREAISAGPTIDVLAALRGANAGPVMAYLAAVLVDNSPIVANLVDELVADAEGYLEYGVETGMVKPSANPRGRAAVLFLWALGALVLHRHVRRILGVDLTNPDIGTDPAIAAYAGPAYEIMGGGVLDEDFAAQLQDVFAEMARANDRATTTSKRPDAVEEPKSKERT
jgi:AcrR family transcriptional regulator